MRGLFYIESPFQLMSAYEAIEAYDLKKFHIFIRLSQSNDKQLKDVAKALFEDEQNITYFYIANKDRNITDYLIALRYYFYHFFQKFNYDYVFIGNYESKFLSVIIKMTNKKKIVLLDDGVKNLYIQKGFTDENNCNVFTMLHTLKPLKSQTILYHEFIHIKKDIVKIFNKTGNETKQIIFLGSKITEAKIISESSYLQYIENILKTTNKNQNILYFPHRGEDLQKLNNIKKSYTNFYIQTINLPIEIYVSQYLNIKNIQYIVSFYSAALISIKLMNKDIETYYLPFDYKQSKYNKEISEVYKNMSLYGVKNFYESNYV